MHTPWYKACLRPRYQLMNLETLINVGKSSTDKTHDEQHQNRPFNAKLQHECMRVWISISNCSKVNFFYCVSSSSNAVLQDSVEADLKDKERDVETIQERVRHLNTKKAERSGAEDQAELQELKKQLDTKRLELKEHQRETTGIKYYLYLKSRFSPNLWQLLESECASPGSRGSLDLKFDCLLLHLQTPICVHDITRMLQQAFDFQPVAW